MIKAPASWERHPGTASRTAQICLHNSSRCSARLNSSSLHAEPRRSSRTLSFLCQFCCHARAMCFDRTTLGAFRIQRCLQRCLAGILHVPLPNKAWWQAQASMRLGHPRPHHPPQQHRRLLPRHLARLRRCRGLGHRVCPCGVSSSPSTERLLAPRRHGPLSKPLVSIFDAHVVNHLLRDAPLDDRISFQLQYIPGAGAWLVAASPDLIHGLETGIEALHRKRFDHTCIGRHSCRRS